MLAEKDHSYNGCALGVPAHCASRCRSSSRRRLLPLVFLLSSASAFQKSRIGLSYISRKTNVFSILKIRPPSKLNRSFDGLVSCWFVAHDFFLDPVCKIHLIIDTLTFTQKEYLNKHKRICSSPRLPPYLAHVYFLFQIVRSTLPVVLCVVCCMIVCV